MTKNDLNSCRFCGESLQLQEIVVDNKNPERNIIKCRKCESQARRKYWNRIIDEEYNY